MRRAVLAAVAVATVLMASATAVADPPGPVGTGDPVINLAGGFTYTVISTACTDSVTPPTAAASGSAARTPSTAAASSRSRVSAPQST